MDDKPNKRTIFYLCLTVSTCAVMLIGMLPLVMIASTTKEWYTGLGVIIGIGCIIGTCIYYALDKKDMK